MKASRYFWILFVVSLLPFVRRPWLFDDPSVVLTAQAAAAHPLNPYAYNLDLQYPDQPNWPAGGLPAYTHPPFSTVCLGELLRVSGNHEWPLHVFMFALALVILGLLRPFVASFTGESDVALFWLMFSPVFFLTTLTLYPHFFYFLFYIATLTCAWKLRQKHSWQWGAAMGLTLTLAALSLHQWPILIGLLVLFFVFEARTIDAWRSAFIGIIIFALLYGSWCLWETHLYGIPHFLATMRVRATGTTYAWRAAFLPLVFLVGGVPVMAIAWTALLQRSRAIVMLLLAILGLMFLVSCRSARRFSLASSADARHILHHRFGFPSDAPIHL